MTDVSGWRKRQVEQSEMCSNYGGFCKKEWVGLTGEEKYKLYHSPMPTMALIEEIELKLKAKNNG